MNIKFDFTRQSLINAATENQEVAVMPAGLAQKLLRLYTTKLTISSIEDIIESHIRILQEAKGKSDLQEAIEQSILWVAERELIQNIQNEKWDAYSVKPTEEEGRHNPNNIVNLDDIPYRQGH